MASIPHTSKWDGRARGSALGNWIFMQIIAAFGPAPAYLLCKAVTCWYAHTNPQLRNVINDFRRTLGLPTGIGCAARHLNAFGVNLIDGVSFLRSSQIRFKVECVGEELFPQMLALGRGVVLLSAHVGNWELAGNLLADRIGAPINPVMLDNEKKSVKKVFTAATARRRVTMIPLSGDGLELMLRVREALRKNEVVCFLADRVLGTEESRELPFFGRPARFPFGPFAVAAITGAPMIVSFTIKTGRVRYLHKAYGVIRLDTISRHNREERIGEAMRQYAGMLESVVREFPCQWFNYYPFWER
jgi:predicted LPLAT superfamily acyltransferase